jgi:endonuclease YncB( thermonuclease family)
VLSGKVTRVIDGDTIDVLLASGRIRVRLHGIDAPERNQAGGAAATAWLMQKVLDRTVLLEPVSQDQYGRMVAIVHDGRDSINGELVLRGHAWAYRRYLREADRELCALEDTARRGRRGLWAATAHAPWEFRATSGKGPYTEVSRSTAGSCRDAMRRRAQP